MFFPLQFSTGYIGDIHGWLKLNALVVGSHSSVKHRLSRIEASVVGLAIMNAFPLTSLFPTSFAAGREEKGAAKVSG